MERGGAGAGGLKTLVGVMEWPLTAPWPTAVPKLPYCSSKSASTCLLLPGLGSGIIQAKPLDLPPPIPAALCS